MISFSYRMIGVGMLLGLGAGSLAADQVLFDFPKAYQPGMAATQDARIENSGGVVRIDTGHQQPWPGITLSAPGGKWDLSKEAQITVNLRNPGLQPLTVACRVDNPGADGTKNCVTSSLQLSPGQTGTLKIDLKRAGDDKLGGKLFGMRGYPVGPGGAGGIDPAKITALLLFLDHPKEDRAFEVGCISASGIYVPPTASVLDASPFFPVHRYVRAI